jgi:two-component system response regulator YesN
MQAYTVSGNIVIDFRGEKTLLVYSFADVVSWIFVKLIPYDDVMRDVYEMRKSLLTIAGSILLIGAVASIVLARRLYKPIDEILGRLVFVERERKDGTRLLRQQHLKRLFLQSKRLSEYELNKLVEDLDIGLANSDAYCLVLIEIDGFRRYCEKHTSQEQNLLRVGIIDEASRLIGGVYGNEGIETDESRLVLIVNLKNEDCGTAKRALRSFASDIQARVEELYRVSVSIAISSAGTSFADISIRYEELLHEAHRKYILGPRIIIDSEIESCKGCGSEDFTYSYEKEKILIEALHCADEVRVLAAYREIIDNARGFGYNALITTRNTLAYAVNKAIDKLVRGRLLDFRFTFYEFFSGLVASETVEEQDGLFSELFASVIAAIEKRNGSAHPSLVTEIIETIRNDYANVNLGISTLAYRYRLSPAYLGRLFREITGKPMYDYINEVRVSRVNELLCDTSLSMARIMEMTGFTNKTHLYKIFKKLNGVTPKLYRQRITAGK